MKRLENVRLSWVYAVSMAAIVFIAFLFGVVGGRLGPVPPPTPTPTPSPAIIVTPTPTATP